MRTAEVIVAAYLQAFGERDFDRLRGYLADRGFRSTSPIGSFDDADRYVDSLFGVGPIIEKVRVRKLFGSDDEAVAIVDITVTLNNYASYVSACTYFSSRKSARSARTSSAMLTS